MDKIKRYVEDFLKTTKVKEEDQLYTNELDACKRLWQWIHLGRSVHFLTMDMQRAIGRRWQK